MAKRYIIGDASGWLKVKLEPSGRTESLSKYIKVEFSSRNGNRDYFEILEGVYKGSRVSVSARGTNTSWLGQPLPSYRGPVSLTFKKGAGEFLSRQVESAISTWLHFQSVSRLKMAGHPCPTRAP